MKLGVVFNFLFRDTIKERNRSYASDADLWDRISKFLKDKNEFGIFININTCKRLTGGTTRTKPKIVK